MQPSYYGPCTLSSAFYVAHFRVFWRLHCRGRLDFTNRTRRPATWDNESRVESKRTRTAPGAHRTAVASAPEDQPLPGAADQTPGCSRWRGDAGGGVHGLRLVPAVL